MASLGKNFIYNALISFSNAAFSLMVFPYVSRVLGPNGVGIVSFAYDYALYFLLLAALGIPTYGAREIARSPDKVTRDRVFSNIFTFHMVSSIVIALFYLISILSFNVFKANLSLHLISVSFVFFSFLACEWYFMGVQELKYTSLFAVFSRIIFLIIVFVYVKDEQDYVYYLLGILASFLINGLLNTIVVLRKIRFNINWSEIKRLLRPLFYLFGSIIAFNTAFLIDSIMLGIIANNEAVGYFSAASKVCRIPILSIVSFGAVLMPRVTQTLLNKEKTDQTLLKYAEGLFVFVLPMCLGLYLISDLMIVLFSGDTFEAAKVCLQILSFLPFLISISNFLGFQVLTPNREDKKVMIASLFGMFLNIVLNALLIPYYSYNGAALATLLSEIFVIILLYKYAAKYLKFSFRFRSLFEIFLALSSFLMVNVLVRYFFKESYLQLFFIISISVIVYFSILFILGNDFVKQALSLLLKRLSSKKT